MEFEEDPEKNAQTSVTMRVISEKKKSTTVSPFEFEKAQHFSFKLNDNENLPEKIKSFLSSSNLEVGSELDSGSFGIVYEARITDAEGQNGDCVLKVEKKLNFFPAGSKFWRAKDFALTRIKIRSTVPPVAFLLHVKVDEKFIGTGAFQKWVKKFSGLDTTTVPNVFFLPADHVKDFGQLLRKEFPEMEVAVIAQVMPKAPGTKLGKIILKAQTPWSLRSQEFRDLLNGCFCFLEDAHFANYVHLDIKPSNIIFDEASRSVYIIDYGLGYRGMKKYNDDGSLKIKTKRGELPSSQTNPRNFEACAGTLSYMAPQVKSNYPNLSKVEKFLFREAYQSNVDAFSVGVTLLEVLGATSHYQSSMPSDDFFRRADFLSKFFSNKKSEDYLEPFLEKNPRVQQKFQNRSHDEEEHEIYELLYWTFEYSKNGNIEKNFQQWQRAFHDFQAKYGYEERFDFQRPSASKSSLDQVQRPIEPKARLRGLSGGWNSSLRDEVK